jgi:hypothetical protein
MLLASQDSPLANDNSYSGCGMLASAEMTCRNVPHSDGSLPTSYGGAVEWSRTADLLITNQFAIARNALGSSDFQLEQVTSALVQTGKATVRLS